MIFQQGRIYYKSIDLFDFDKTLTFLNHYGIELFTPSSIYSSSRKDQSRDIFAYDSSGDYYSISSSEAIKEKLANKDFLSFNIWLGEEQINWIFYYNSLFSFVFYFDLVDREKFDFVVRIIFELFLSEIDKESLLGMYIDKEDKTEEFDWDHFFADEKARLDILPDTVCVRQEKLDCVKVANGYIVHPLNHGFYAITRDPAVLCCFPLS